MTWIQSVIQSHWQYQQIFKFPPPLADSEHEYLQEGGDSAVEGMLL